MANENNGNANPTNDDKELLDLEKKQEELDAELQAIENSDDLDALKEIAKKQHEVQKEIREKNKQLFARAKSAEGFVLKDGKYVKKEKPPEKKPDEFNKPNQSQGQDDSFQKTQVLLLQDKGLPDEAIELLVKIQKLAKLDGKDITLIQAQKDPIYISQKETWDREEKRKKAQLPPGGGGSGGSKKDSDKELSRDEHKALAAQKAKEILK